MCNWSFCDPLCQTIGKNSMLGEGEGDGGNCGGRGYLLLLEWGRNHSLLFGVMKLQCLVFLMFTVYSLLFTVFCPISCLFA